MTADHARRVVGVASGVVLLLGGAASAATSASDPSVVTIQMQRGSICWKYTGTATTFNGTFKAGQKLDVTSTGDFTSAGATGLYIETAPRAVYVADAKSGKLLPANGPGHYTVPQTGLYQITFGPMAVVGSPGVMIVCKV